MSQYNIVEFGDCVETMKQWKERGIQAQMCVTSPPYYRLRSYLPSDHPDKALEIGLEQTPEQYIENMVKVFRSVRDVLADDGVLWVNIGDSYAANREKQVPSTKGGKKHSQSQAADGMNSVVPTGCKPKDLIGIPWMLAFALRADGWYLRQDIVWNKKNPMPESVKDRCTKSHEYIFLLSKSEQYFFDHESIKEDSATPPVSRNKAAEGYHADYPDGDRFSAGERVWGADGKRNKRSVWTVSAQPYAGAHFACFPPALIEPCILAGTSPVGHCPKCGARWARQVESKRVPRHELPKDNPNYRPSRYKSKSNGLDDYSNGGGQAFCFSKTIGFAPTCKCGCEPVEDVVLDPFAGSGTTMQVAVQNKRQYLGCELNREYEALQKKRLSKLQVKLF